MVFAVLPLAASSVAAAQQKESLLTADQLQVESSKPLLLRRRAPINRSGLDAFGVASIVAAVEQARFDVKDGDFQSPDIGQWCMRSAADAAQRMGDVDNKGQARVSTDALQARCSAVYAYTLDVGHSCSYQNKKKQWECSASAHVAISKARATVGASGTPALTGDGSFGEGGQYTLDASGSGSSKDLGAAQREAASSAAFQLERNIRDVPGFQLRGPLTDATKASASFCLGADVLELDQAFHLVKVDEAGERVDVGWGKVRSIHDGCVLTDGMQSRAPGKTAFDLQPARIETIIGRGDVRAGMTALEMPSTGLNLGMQAGTAADPAGAQAIRVDVVGEYDLARHTGASELYAFGHLGLVLPDASTRTNIANQLGRGVDTGTTIAGVQGELGLLKRTYFGRPFVDYGGAFTGSAYSLPSMGYEDILVYGYGVAAKLGVGLQVSPRFAVRALATARAAFLSTVSKSSGSSSNSTETSAGGLDSEVGAGVQFGFLYTL